MNILITGDSWGVPKYDDITDVPVLKFEYHFSKLGYNIYNSSMCGGSNLEAIERSTQLLSGGSILHPSSRYNQDHQRYTTRPDVQLLDIPRIDWIIWFHTEFGRDWYRFEFSDHDMFFRIAKETYTKFFELKKSIMAKAIVIGGQGPVFPTIRDYGDVDLLIPDWRNELLCKDPTAKSALNSKKSQLAGTQDQKYETWINNPALHEFLKESPDFPDNSHPSDQCHKELAEQLHEFIQNNASETG